MAGRTAFVSISLALVSVLGLGLSGCKKSETAQKLGGFAEKVCACKDAACAKQVEAEFLAWRDSNKRARGSAKERKQVEKAMERYATCHAELVKEAPIPENANQVDLTPEPAKPAEPTEPATEPSKVEATPPTDEGTPTAAGADAGTGAAPVKPSTQPE